MTASARLGRAHIRSLRGAKDVVVPGRALGTNLDQQLSATGEVEECLTVFLAGAECPFTCTFCDLWRFTLDSATAVGDIPRQIRDVLDAQPNLKATQLKLYNASNFFDERAVPEADDGEIASLVSRFQTVTVECHPRLFGERALAFASRLSGRLEVAMGLEVADDTLLRLLNKETTLRQFAQTAERILQAGMLLRTFVLLGPPYVAPSQRTSLLKQTLRFAMECGSHAISLIPLRADGAVQSMVDQGTLAPLTLLEVESQYAAAQRWVEQSELPTNLRLDIWDLEHFVRCSHCDPARLERLRATVLQRVPKLATHLACEHCSARPA